MADSRNITTKLTIENLAKQIKAGYATKAELPTKVSDLTNDSKFQTETQVNDKIKAAVSGALQPAGSVAFANLPALTEANLNKIVNVTDKFTTTADFVEGAGAKYPAGTNVAIINVGTAEAPSYKYDVYTGVIDTSGFMEKVASGSAGKLVKSTADGGVELTDIDASKVLTEHQDISGKADKPTTATNGNVAKFDANKNPVDSGIAADDLQVKIASATNDNLVAMDADGKVKNSGIAGANVLTTADISDYSEDEIAVLLGLKEASAG